jgi:hypothetical protein
MKPGSKDGAAARELASGANGVAGEAEQGVAGEVREGVAGRRGFVLAVVGCAVGAGLVLWATSRTWLTDVTVRPAPLPSVATARSGGSLVPALPALALVALAGAGALVATRRRLRTALGILLSVTGLALVALAVGSVSRGGAWAGLGALGGVLVSVSGLATLRFGIDWPSLGSRYERGYRKTTLGTGADGGLWDALERGEDPTQV